MSRISKNAPLVLGPVQQSDNLRKYGRIRCERLRCTLDGHEGTVVDLSAGGARLQFHGKTGYESGESGTLIVESDTAPPLSLGMKVMWVKKRGFRRHEVGISFGEPLAAVRAALGQVIRSASVTNTVYRETIE